MVEHFLLYIILTILSTFRYWPYTNPYSGLVEHCFTPCHTQIQICSNVFYWCSVYSFIKLPSCFVSHILCHVNKILGAKSISHSGMNHTENSGIANCIYSLFYKWNLLCIIGWNEQCNMPPSLSHWQSVTLGLRIYGISSIVKS